MKQITLTTPNDDEVLQCVGLAMNMAAESEQFRDMNMEFGQVRDFMFRMSASPTCFIKVALYDRSVVGMIIGQMAHYEFHNSLYAYDRLLYVDPKSRGSRAAQMLITAFEQWARDNGASRVLLGISTDVHKERTEQFYNKLGYCTVGALTSKEIR